MARPGYQAYLSEQREMPERDFINRARASSPAHGQSLMTVQQAAVHLSVSKHALYRKIKSGEYPAYRFGRKVLVDLEEVKQAMRTTMRPGNPQHNGTEEMQ